MGGDIKVKIYRSILAKEISELRENTEYRCNKMVTKKKGFVGAPASRDKNLVGAYDYYLRSVHFASDFDNRNVFEIQ